MAITRMTVNEIVNTYAPVYAPSWEESTQTLIDDPSSHLNILDLMEELQRDGSYRKPIILSDPTEEDEHDELCVLNGHHRLTAAYKLGWTEPLNVQIGYQIPSHEETDEYSMYPVSVTRIMLSAPEVTEQQHSMLLDRLMSFRVSNSEWFESDMVSSSMNGRHFDVWWVAFEYDERSVHATETLMHSIITSITGYGAKIETVPILTEEQLDKFYDELDNCR